jgi:hypothetical protein
MVVEAKLTRIVGAANVVNKEKVLDEYSRDMSFVNRVKPACIVRPKNDAEVEKIGKLAIEGHYSVPLGAAMPSEEIGASACNYHVWLGRLEKAFDPNLVGARTGFSYRGADTSGERTNIYKPRQRRMPVNSKKSPR